MLDVATTWLALSDSGWPNCERDAKTCVNDLGAGAGQRARVFPETTSADHPLVGTVSSPLCARRLGGGRRSAAAMSFGRAVKEGRIIERIRISEVYSAQKKRLVTWGAGVRQPIPPSLSANRPLRGRPSLAPEPARSKQIRFLHQRLRAPARTRWQCTHGWPHHRVFCVVLETLTGHCDSPATVFTGMRRKTRLDVVCCVGRPRRTPTSSPRSTSRAPTSSPSPCFATSDPKSSPTPTRTGTLRRGSALRGRRSTRCTRCRLTRASAPAPKSTPPRSPW